MSNLKVWKFIFTYFLGWRLILLFVTFYGLNLLPSINDIDYFMRWANWDGGHFRGIAENGYLNPFQVAFFPLYPILIKVVMFFGLNSFWAGFFISQISTLIALFYFYKLLLLDYDLNTVHKGIFVLLAFPTSFYLGTVYSEGLFLALVTSSFYYARKNNWILAAGLASLSAITRLVGLATIVAVASEYFFQNQKSLNLASILKKRINRVIAYLILFNLIFFYLNGFLINKINLVTLGVLISTAQLLGQITVWVTFTTFGYFLIKMTNLKKLVTLPALWLILSIVPFLTFSFHLYQTQGDALAYLTHQKNWGRQLGFPWEVYVNNFNYFTTFGFFRTGIVNQTLLEFIFGLIFAIGFFISLFKLRYSYSIYYGLSIILPMSTNTLAAIHRYALVLFPLMIIIASIKNKQLFNLWLIFSLVLLGILSVMFINGYWVA